ncbi:MAG TPA: pseudouridine-5'-phosphate glycosidase, partial [Acidimicrobiales bacterium]
MSTIPAHMPGRSRVAVDPSVLRVHDEVRDALASGRPVVALETTIFSHLGLPSPHNAAALERCLLAIRSAGAVPAITAVLDGVARVGLEPAEHERILGGARKLSARDVPVAIAQRWTY